MVAEHERQAQRTLVPLQLAKSKIVFSRSSDADDAEADSSFVNFLLATVILPTDGSLTLCPGSRSVLPV